MPAITKLSKKQEKAAKFKKGQLKKDEKAKKATVENESNPMEGSADAKDTQSAKAKPKGQKRNTLFIGNLPYDIDAETLNQHFGNAKPDMIRMRKGFAFFDFNSSETLQAALRFHHSTLKYRKINVELTAGGGGNSKVRKAKLDKKNKAMHEELAEQIERDAKQSDAKREERRQKDKKQLAKDMENVHPSRRQNFD